MSLCPSRRVVLVAGAALAACASRADPDLLAPLEAESGGRVGVFALDLSSGRSLGHRADERFAMCSTFKFILGGLVLARVDAGEERLDRLVRYGPEDLVSYSPATEPNAGAGVMSVGDLCAATIGVSDNTAANLLLATLGGPEGFTARLRRFGDATTRLDRLEPALNENAPGDLRDTSTPRALVETLRVFAFTDALSSGSRETLKDWMRQASTGLKRLRAGMPQRWDAGDKTGTSSNAQSNDVAFAVAPEGVSHGPLLIASLLNIPRPIGASADALHARIASIASATLIEGSRT
jgi:beta-lactamase class A